MRDFLWEALRITLVIAGIALIAYLAGRFLLGG